MRFVRSTSILFIVLSWSTLQARTFQVCKNCQHTRIADAISLAQDGDTIRISRGRYVECNIQIEKNLTLIGESGAVIDGGFMGTILSVHADSFSISGLLIENVGSSYTKDHAAILVHGAKKFNISDIKMSHVFFGCLIEKSSNGTIWDNSITSEAKVEAGSGNGIHLWHCSYIDIARNKLSGLRDGIYFEFVRQSKIYDNHSFKNLRYGLHFMFSNNNVYKQNIFEQNGAGVAVMFSKFITMENNTFRDNWGSASYGLLLKEIYDSDLVGNEFQSNTIGIHVEGANRIKYHLNRFYKNGWAIKVIGACYENIFEKNDFVSNSFDLSYSSKLNDNIFRNNYWSEYSGYDLNKDGIGDVPHRPVNLFSYIVSRTPESIILLRSLFIYILNFSEKVSPVFTPENLSDSSPKMSPNL